MSVASGSYCTDAVSTATTSTARASPARTMSRARRRHVAPQKQPLKLSSCFSVSSESPSSWMSAAEMPGSDQPLVQVVTTCVMSDSEPPQLAIASRAAASASFGAWSIQERARRLPGGSKPCGVKMSSTSTGRSSSGSQHGETKWRVLTPVLAAILRTVSETRSSCPRLSRAWRSTSTNRSVVIGKGRALPYPAMWASGIAGPSQRAQASTMSFDRLSYGVGTGGSAPESRAAHAALTAAIRSLTPNLRVDPLGVLVDRLGRHLQLLRRSPPSSCRASSTAAPPPRAGRARATPAGERRAARAALEHEHRRAALAGRAGAPRSGLPP